MALPEKKPGKKPEAKKPSPPAGGGTFVLFTLGALIAMPFYAFSASSAPAAPPESTSVSTGTSPTPFGPSGTLDNWMCGVYKSAKILGWGCGKPHVPLTDDGQEAKSNRFPMFRVLSRLFSKPVSPVEAQSAKAGLPRRSLAKEGQLFRLENSEQVHYLTAAGYLRTIPNEEVFNSYGDKKEAVKVIDQKQLDSYPRGEYIYLEGDLSRDVYKIVGTSKRYVTNSVIVELGLKNEQIAPVNKTEFDYYKKAEPLLK